MYSLLTLFIFGVISMFAGLWRRRDVLYGIATAGLALSLGVSIFEWMTFEPMQPGSALLNGMLSFDYFSLGFAGVAIFATLLIAMLSGYSFKGVSEALGDHYALILFSLCGVLCTVSFESLVMLFLGLEIMSIPLYVLAGSRRDNLASNEAALKYYLMGSFTTGILLFGIALVYGATLHFDLLGIQQYVAAGKISGLFYVGVIFILIGMCFKIAAAPFHFWSPDVYEGSPSLVTAFMATVVKTAGFAAFFRLFSAFSGAADHWAMPLAIIAGLTMTVGNVTAVFQYSFKRMLAYSSISHAGYLLLGVVAMGANSSGAILLYALSYSVATICIFGIYIIVREQTGRTDFEAFNGLAQRKPFLAFVMALCLISLAGIPPTAGFFGKYFLFSGAMGAYPWLVVVAVLNSAISISYYFRPIVAMYFTPSPEQPAELTTPVSYTVVLVVGAAMVVALCILPGYVLGLV